MDKMAKSIPVGVTLNTVRQQGMNITFSGYSQSNARVSAYLQSLEQNDLFLAPELRVVRTSERVVNPGEPYEFTINAKLRPRIGADDEEGYEDAGDYDEAEDGGTG
jgi:type IV pilus assembly protein PilN